MKTPNPDAGYQGPIGVMDAWLSSTIWPEGHFRKMRKLLQVVNPNQKTPSGAERSVARRQGAYKLVDPPLISDPIKSILQADSSRQSPARWHKRARMEIKLRETYD